jgi:hypothetical protein
MKWYSLNSIEGCVPLTDIVPNGNKNSYVWLIIVRPNGSINIQHGSGNPNTTGQNCTLYKSYLDDSVAKGYRTVKTNEVKYFMHPFCGCNDTHTYLEFLKSDIEKDGNLVYFYNPNFPGASSFDDAVED